MNIDAYHPIRQKLVWVAIIQSVATALVLTGVSVADLEVWTNWVFGVLNILVLLGVLAKGATEAEQLTTPLSDAGTPLNPDFHRKGSI